MVTTESYLSNISSSLDRDYGFEGNASLSNITFGPDSPGLPQAFQTLNVAVRLIEGCLAILSNSLTIIAIAKYEFLRSNTNMLICNLAFSDLVGGLSPLFLLAQYIFQTDVKVWLGLCATEQMLNMISSGLNLMTIVWVSLDRFIYINFPLRYPALVQRFHIILAILFSWVYILSLIISATALGVTPNEGLVCRSQLIYVYKKLIPWFTNGVFVSSCVPILALYTQIGYVALKQTRRIKSEQNAVESVSTGLSKRENKITKMMAVVLGTYFICYIPQIVLVVALRSVRETPLWLVMAERSAAWIWWMNSWLNPFIYAWNSKDFNRGFRLLLGLNLQQNPQA